MNKTVTKKKKRLGIFNTILLAVLITYSAALILLVVWGLITSVKTLDDFFGNKFLLPTGNITEWGWDNYAYVLSNFSVKMRKAGVGVISINMFGQLVNTLIYTFGSAFCVTACTCIVAYLSAKFNYLCSKIVYTLVLIVMTIPIVGNTPSMLLFLHQTNLYDNWLGMILMNFHFGGVYFLVFYGIYSGISSEYEEAATIDGANE